MDNTLLALALLIVGISLILYHPRFFGRPLSPKTRFWIGLLQLVPLLLLVWLIGDPRAERKRSITKERLALLLVDDSASMGYGDGLSGGSRIETVRSWIDEMEKVNGASEKKRFSQVAYLSELVPRGRATSDFAAAFTEIGRRYPRRTLASVIFVSDGRDRGAREVESVAKRLEVPIHTIGIGPAVEPDSLEARFLEVPDIAQPGSPFLVEWSVDSNFEETRPAFASIRFASREVFTREFELRKGTDHREDWVSVTPIDPGVHVLTLEVQAEDSTVPTVVSEATLTVADSPPTLLVLESAPTKGVRSLTQTALDSGRYRVLRPVPLPEGGVALWDLFRPPTSAVESERTPWERESVRRFSPEEWETEIEALLSETAAVVLGDRPWRGLSDSFPKALEAFLSESRVGILALSGSQKQREKLPAGGNLADLLEWMSTRQESHNPLQLRFPDSASEHPALAPLWSVLERTRRLGPDFYFKETPLVSTPLILDERERTIVFSVPLGLGRATLVAPSNFWSLTAFSDSPGDRRFLEGFWLGLLDDLAVAKWRDLITVKAEPETAAIGRRVRVRVRDPALRPGPPLAGLQVRRGSEGWRNLILTPDPNWKGVGEAIWIPREVGTFEIRYASGETSQRIEVVDRPAEPGDRALDEAHLRSLAEATGGEYRNFRDRARVLEAIQPQSETVVRTEESPLRRDAKIGALLATLFCAGWGVRRAFSLP